MLLHISAIFYASLCWYIIPNHNNKSLSRRFKIWITYIRLSYNIFVLPSGVRCIKQIEMIMDRMYDCIYLS
jgi:hypothetical protein